MWSLLGEVIETLDKLLIHRATNLLSSTSSLQKLLVPWRYPCCRKEHCKGAGLVFDMLLRKLVSMLMHVWLVYFVPAGLVKIHNLPGVEALQRK